MAYFYGSLNGNRGTAIRTGTAQSGYETIAASLEGAVRCTLYVKDGVDCVIVQLVPWHGAGTFRQLYSGPISGAEGFAPTQVAMAERQRRAS